MLCVDGLVRPTERNCDKDSDIPPLFEWMVLTTNICINEVIFKYTKANIAQSQQENLCTKMNLLYMLLEDFLYMPVHTRPDFDKIIAHLRYF